MLPGSVASPPRSNREAAWPDGTCLIRPSIRMLHSAAQKMWLTICRISLFLRRVDKSRQIRLSAAGWLEVCLDIHLHLRWCRAHVCRRGIQRGCELGDQGKRAICQKHPRDVNASCKHSAASPAERSAWYMYAKQCFAGGPGVSAKFQRPTPGGRRGALERFDRHQPERGGASDQQATIEAAQHVSDSALWPQARQ